MHARCERSQFVLLTVVQASICILYVQIRPNETPTYRNRVLFLPCLLSAQATNPDWNPDFNADEIIGAKDGSMRSA